MGKWKFGRTFCITTCLCLSLALTGCSSSDGTDGTAGTAGLSAYEIAVNNGFAGTEAEWVASLAPSSAATTASPESCAVCHTAAVVNSYHDATGVFTISTIAAVANGAAIDVTFNVKVDGVNNDGYTLDRGYVSYDAPAQANITADAITTLKRDTITTNVTLVANGSGNYTATVAAASVRPDSTYLFRLKTTADGTQPVVVANYGTRPLRDLVSNAGCANCHGDYPAYNEIFNHYAVGGSECQICHSQGVSRSTTFISKDAAGAFVEEGLFYGTNLAEYVHGIHNSHNMSDGIYYRTTAPDATADAEDRYSIGYPSDMRNCSVCHTTPAQLAAAATAPVTGYLCFTCHRSWKEFVDHNGDPLFVVGEGLGTIHLNMAVDANCSVCHNGSIARNKAADFHNSFEGTDSHYNSFYGGEDVSFSNPNDVSFAITGVTKAGSNVTFTWTATKNAAAVDPCNAAIASGPTFKGLGAYLAYAKGDDWVNDGVGTAPGQPLGAKNLFTALSTTCAANVATTTGLTVSPAATYAEKALLAIGGKPLDTHAVAGKSFFVRVPTPNFTFSMTDGTSAVDTALARRAIVDNAKCTGCHRGTLYQHGGDRVDNTQLCVVCHNPAANDKNNRVTAFQVVNADGTVDTDSTYDGKTAQSYDMRTMIHGIHGVNFKETPLVIYRSRGIYAFVTADTAKPTGWPLDGMTIYGSDNASKIAHNWTVVHYPQELNNCEACHNAGTYGVADQTKAVAVTVDAGTDWTDQSDDIVIGPTAAACTSCHNTAPARSHAEGFGYKANVTKDAMLQLSN